MVRYTLGNMPPVSNVRFVGEIPLLKELFDKFVKKTTMIPDYRVFVLRAIEIVYCILPEYQTLKVSTQANSYAYDIRHAYIGSLGGYFSRNFHSQEIPPATLYEVEIDGTIVVDLKYVNDIVTFFINGPKSSFLLANIFNKFTTSPHVEGPGGLGSQTFLTIATSLFKNNIERAFLYFNIFFLNLGFFRIPCLESFLDFSNIALTSSPVFCETQPDSGLSLAKSLFDDISTVFKKVGIANISSYEKLQALYVLYFSDIPVAKFAPLIENTWGSLRISDTVLKDLLTSKALTDVARMRADVGLEEIIKRALCISFLCDQKYLGNRKALDRVVGDKTTLDRYFLSLPTDLQGVLDSNGKMKNIFSGLQQNLITALDGKAWVAGLNPVSAKREVSIEGEVRESASSCSLEALLKQGPDFVNKQFDVPKGKYTVLSLLSFIFKQFPLNPTYPSVRVLFFTNSKTKSSLATISDTALELYTRLVFYTVQCFVQKNCMSVASIKEIPEQALSNKAADVTVETKARDALKLALGVSLGLTIFTGTVLTFKMYRYINPPTKKRDSK